MDAVPYLCSRVEGVMQLDINTWFVQLPAAFVAQIIERVPAPGDQFPLLIDGRAATYTATVRGYCDQEKTVVLCSAPCMLEMVSCVRRNSQN